MRSVRRTIVAGLFLAALMVGTVHAQSVRSGTVDGHYYKWIFEGKHFIVCTNISKEKGAYVHKYLEWAYPTIASLFDAQNRHRYQKKYEVNFDRLKVKGPVPTKTGNQQWYQLQNNVQAWVEVKGGYTYIKFPGSKETFYFHKRNLAGKKLIVHYARDDKEDRLIRKAWPEDLGSEYGRAFYQSAFGVDLIDKTFMGLPYNETLTTAIHETCHWMFDYSSFQRPKWFNEGYACYLWVDGEFNLRVGDPRFDMLKRIREAVKKGEFIALNKFITFDYKTFIRYDRNNLCYAESWALFSYLNSEASGMQNNFYNWYNRMRNGEDATQVFRQLFNVNDLQRKVIAWCDFQLNQLLKNHYESYDTNKNGQVDYWDVYQDGYHKYVLQDKDENGKVDLWLEYWPHKLGEKGVRKLWAKDRNGDEAPDWKNVCNKRGQCTRVLMDNDYDGKFEIDGPPK